MRASLLLLIGVVFFTLVVRAWLSGEIPGKGWGFKMRVYERESEPSLYWMNFVTYFVAAMATTAIALMEIFGRP